MHLDNQDIFSRQYHKHILLNPFKELQVMGDSYVIHIYVLYQCIQ